MLKVKSEKFETTIRIVLAFVFSFVLFGVVIAICGHNPIDAFISCSEADLVQVLILDL